MADTTLGFLWGIIIGFLLLLLFFIYSFNSIELDKERDKAIEEWGKVLSCEERGGAPEISGRTIELDECVIEY